jgi:ribosomal protein S27AE
MTRWKSKGCPKCGGNVFIDRDLDCWYEQCLQCSYRKELESVFKYKRKSSPAREESGNKSK